MFYNNYYIDPFVVGDLISLPRESVVPTMLRLCRAGYTVTGPTIKCPAWVPNPETSLLEPNALATALSDAIIFFRSSTDYQIDLC